ncbi:hypothetical protein NG895_02040 [Aeoliella sp. ICT_H6.2]|uniref:Uncharacterized protein n=1 Tax=Aeoliella straminimaris TaxID=2954799 RepID=A0A9X2FEN0_9BACT|nr:hypothetical protein [Aeoliella straminimaris]MCO6042676.1 hypothetical protein [Aeoliella straminimaris]
MKTKREFDGGYCRTNDVPALIEARKQRAIGKNELRLFFAKLEHRESRGMAPVDVVLNKHRKQKKRMTIGQQDAANERLVKALAEHQPQKEAYRVKLPRKFVRSAARGALEVSEMVTALCYFLRRMPQRSRRKCLVRSERYCRLSVRTVRKLTGLCHDVIVASLRLLRNQKLIALVWRPMVETSRYGRMFVDGSKISVNYHAPERSRASTPSVRMPNSGTAASQNRNEKKETLPKNSFYATRDSFEGKRSSILAFAARFCPEHGLSARV